MTGVKDHLKRMTTEVEFQPHDIPGGETYYEMVPPSGDKVDKYADLMSKIPNQPQPSMPTQAERAKDEE